MMMARANSPHTQITASASVIETPATDRRSSRSLHLLLNEGGGSGNEAGGHDGLSGKTTDPAGPG